MNNAAAQALQTQILEIAKSAVADLTLSFPDKRNPDHTWTYGVEVRATRRGIQICVHTDAVINTATSRALLNDGRNAIANALAAHFGHSCNVAPGTKVMMTKVDTFGFWHMSRWNVTGYHREFYLKAVEAA